ncbi:NAD(P)/FAD-dependent oxidoreductase [Anaerorhabdus furcosa]|uniref:FAD-dependent protein C-terminal domain-containing protein n=1 Tax=Anaerorhabdus furcosa TaxID=118967 RepID=A0A1T4PVP6_9FIRM|nr:hypothetical protein [Anaerorhabdus furcosa]SJZ95529.1 hypothetical protein SAMN02745191_2192 [Anaerorhabdus furcosa]
MLLINQIKCTLDDECTKETISRKIGCPIQDIISFKINKESIDARKDEIHFVYTVQADVKNESRYIKRKDVSLYEPTPYVFPTLDKPITHRPIVVGFGPSGMFAGLYLAEAGCKPIIFERGSAIENRIHDVDAFWNEGILNTESNVQFGEGGAGTFSDGKLTTRIKDPRVTKVIEELIEAGADEDIAYVAHPHIGTDQLRGIVKNIRNKIIQLGGEIHFNTKFENLILSDNQIVGVQAGGITYDTDTVFLCAGHSAKDTYESLYNQSVYIEPKGFAVGLRVEHKQDFINHMQYGSHANHPRLKTAEYRITHTANNGRGVYSFCMCPGGYVISSSNNENTIVINGMSEHDRNQENANSALLVQVHQEDFYKNSPFDGFNYQHELEAKAFQLGNGQYKAPIQLVSDYLENKVTTELKGVTPSYSLGTTFANLQELFSSEINEAMVEALTYFEKRMPGFSSGDAVFTGVETRSSSPIRVLRNAQLESTSTPNLYPCGEGAGYAGGIVSSAVDGLRCAEQFIRKISY